MLKIAICGKGGSGKTTLSALLARAFAEDKTMRVIAVDCDPCQNLCSSLGFPNDLEAKITPITELRGLIEERTGSGGGGAFLRLNPNVSDILTKYSIECFNVNLLVMGGLSEGKRGCFCPENIFVKSLIDHLVLDRDEIVILDMEAGVEHLTRGTASGVDMSLVVVEPERRSVQTGLKISSLCKEIGIPRVFFICNKIRTQEDKAFLTSVVTEEDILCFVPFDEELTSLSRGEGSPYDSASLRAWASENAKKIRVFMERGAT